jgi:hypothetical protein
MPKIKMLETTIRGSKFQSPLMVDSKGQFSTKGPIEENGDYKLLSGDKASKVETAWKEHVREFAERTQQKRKVLCIRYDSILRAGGAKDAFTSRDNTMLFECCVAQENTTKQGAKTEVTYSPCPEFEGLHAPQQPFPSRMVLSTSEVNFHKNRCTIIPWSQESEEVLVRACRGLEAVAQMLDHLTASPESFLEASQKILLLPQPENHGLQG